MFATANSLRLQGHSSLYVVYQVLTNPLPEYLAKAISNYLTSETGVTVIFESAIVPKWKDSRISFKNVYISRRPQSTKSIQKKATPLGHKAAVAYDVSTHPAYNYSVEEDEEVAQNHADDDVNYSMFDLNIDSIDVTLSLKRWLDGKGLVEDAVVKGVRGVLGELLASRCSQSIITIFQIDALFSGIRKILWTPPPFEVWLVLVTLNCIPSNWKMCSSQYISQATFVPTPRPFSMPIYGLFASSGYSMISCTRKTL